MRSAVLKIAVRKNGEIVLWNSEMTKVLSHKQLGIHTKPHASEEFMWDVRREVEHTWDVLNGRGTPGGRPPMV